MRVATVARVAIIHTAYMNVSRYSRYSRYNTHTAYMILEYSRKYVRLVVVVVPVVVEEADGGGDEGDHDHRCEEVVLRGVVVPVDFKQVHGQHRAARDDALSDFEPVDAGEDVDGVGAEDAKEGKVELGVCVCVGEMGEMGEMRDRGR